MNTEERVQFIADIAEAVNPRSASLSDEEQRWVRLAIQREVQAVQFRRAVIEKTLAGLIWVALIGIGGVFLEYIKNHGFKS